MSLEKGCLLIADISGYTKYLVGVELEHSHDILADLLGTVCRELQRALEVAKLEGDAVFCYDIDREDGEGGSALIALVDNCYFAFKRRVLSINRLTTCSCNACSRIPDLGLKFVIHHGEFVLHEVLGRSELVGREVVVVHRLLKNSFTGRGGPIDYALVTQACVEQLGLDRRALGMAVHKEVFEDVGELQCYVHDLSARWTREQERGLNYVEAGRGTVEVEADLPADAPAVWDFVTSPHKRPLWQPGALRIDQLTPGPMAVGTTNHCVHGDSTVHEEVVDWKPFQYISLRWNGPLGLILGTIELTPQEDQGTRLSLRMVADGSDGGDALTAAAATLSDNYRQGFDRLAQLLRRSSSW